jgi:predicted DNA-binding antitoxin AbrB/MazE fold protein
MVSRVVEAVYKDGVLKPVEPLSLDEHKTVRLSILEDQEAMPPTTLLCTRHI